MSHFLTCFISGTEQKIPFNSNTKQYQHKVHLSAALLNHSLSIILIVGETNEMNICIVEAFFGSLVVLYFSKAAISVSALHTTYFSTHSLTNKPARHSSSAAVGLNSCPSYFMPSPATRRLLCCSQHRTITEGPRPTVRTDTSPVSYPGPSQQRDCTMRQA